MRAFNPLVASVPLVVLTSLFFFSSCQNLRTGSDDAVSDASNLVKVWELKTKFKDLKKGRNLSGRTQVLMDGRERLRIDVYGPIGFVKVGNLIIDGELLYLKLMSGDEYRGTASRDGIKKLLKIPVDPQDLFSLFHQKGFDENDWSCEMSERGSWLKSCENREYGVSAKWSGSMEDSRTKLDLIHSRAELSFSVKKYRESSQIDPKAFQF